MKRAGNLWQDIVSRDNFLLAFLKALRGKRNSPPAIVFCQNVDANLEKLRYQLINNQYRISEYRQVKIYDPKERVISALSFPDRVVQHAIMNVIEPYFERQMIFHTYACRKDKGSHRAIRAVLNHIQPGMRFLKLDVRKYFDSISHDILKAQLCRLFKDRMLLQLLFHIIDSYETVPNKGLPIGNLTSQFFANLYLSPFDHFILERLKPHFYCRYMDDMIMIYKDGIIRNGGCAAISDYTDLCLNISFKEPTFGHVSDGVPFLGFLIRPKKVVPLRIKRQRSRYKMKMILRLYRSGIIDEQTAARRAECLAAAVKC